MSYICDTLETPCESRIFLMNATLLYDTIFLARPLILLLDTLVQTYLVATSVAKKRLKLLLQMYQNTPDSIPAYSSEDTGAGSILSAKSLKPRFDPSPCCC